MGFFWFCVLLDIIAYSSHPLHTPYDLVVFVSQCVIQLLALPVIGITTDIASNKMLKLLQETHDTVMQAQIEQHEKLDLIIAELKCLNK